MISIAVSQIKAIQFHGKMKSNNVLFFALLSEDHRHQITFEERFFFVSEVKLRKLQHFQSKFSPNFTMCTLISSRLFRIMRQALDIYFIYNCGFHFALFINKRANNWNPAVRVIKSYRQSGPIVWPQVMKNGGKSADVSKEMIQYRARTLPSQLQ